MKQKTLAIEKNLNNTLKGVGLLHKLRTFLLQQTMLDVYIYLQMWPFLWPHLSYADYTYDQLLNE